MRKVLYSIGLILSIFMSVNLFAQSYEGMTENKMIELYKQSCEAEQFANCYQLGLIYQKYPEVVFGKNEDPAENKTGAKLARENFQKACAGNEKAACKELNGSKVYEGASLLYYVGLLLIGLAVFLISKTIFQDEDQFQAQEKLEDSKTQVDEIAKHGIILRYSRPFFKRYFSPIVSGMKNKKSFREKYRRKLAAAGLTNILTPEDFFAFKLFLIIGFPIFLHQFINFISHLKTPIRLVRIQS